MKLVSNWQKMYKSLAVVLPTVAVFAIALIGAATDSNLIPPEYMGFVVLVTGFLGRIIKQPRIGVK